MQNVFAAYELLKQTMLELGGAFHSYVRNGEVKYRWHPLARYQRSDLICTNLGLNLEPELLQNFFC